MYCPECRTEFREGFARCSECDVDLVEILPLEDEPEYVELVTVFEGDPNGAAVVSGALTGAGIDSWIKDEGIQGVFPNLGPAEVQVSLEDNESALAALESAVLDADSPSEGNR